ncbi:MAG TPA: hypothetical protein PKE64_15870 [Anaerolineae bacterium]|nr:hypothetical protein [Anaerolineae bacterium]HMR65484.1 hypothetical protein [Anaerolineae bacterium]
MGDEAAIPIRLLSPAEWGPPPEENTIRVRLVVEQAERVGEA